MHVLIAASVASTLAAAITIGGWQTAMHWRLLDTIRSSRLAVEDAALALRSAALVHGTAVLLPAPAAGVSYAEIPQVGARRTAHVPLHYCAWSDHAGTGTTVALPSGGSYNISTMTVAGHPYVTGSDAPPVAGLRAAVVAPAGEGRTPPDCTSITVGADGRLQVTGGYVAGITEAEILRYGVASGGAVLHVSPDGGGDGRSAAEPVALAEAMDLWAATRPARLTIALQAGDYAVPTVTTVAPDATLSLVGPATGTATIGTSSDTLQIHARVVLGQGIEIPGRMTVPSDGEADLDAVAIGALSVSGRATLNGTIVGPAAGSAVAASGAAASVSISGASIEGDLGVLSTGGAVVSVDGADITAPVAVRASGGNVVITGSLTATGVLMADAAGSVAVAAGASAATSSHGVIAQDGGRMVIDGAVTATGAGLVDDGAAHIAGAGTISGAPCWSGPLFGWSGLTSAPDPATAPAEALLLNVSAATCS